MSYSYPYPFAGNCCYPLTAPYNYQRLPFGDRLRGEEFEEEVFEDRRGLPSTIVELLTQSTAIGSMAPTTTPAPPPGSPTPSPLVSNAPGYATVLSSAFGGPRDGSWRWNRGARRERHAVIQNMVTM